MISVVGVGTLFLIAFVACATNAFANSCDDNTPHVVGQCDNSRKTYTLWWFVDTTDAGAAYPTSITVETNGYSSTYFWYLSGNTSAALFSNGSTFIATGSANYAAVVSTGVSNSEGGDVYIQWGNQYGYLSPRRKLVVRAPDKMKRKNTVIRRHNETHLWRTHIFYETRDQFNRVLPATVSHNEQWDTGEFSNTSGGDNWTRNQPGSGYNNPANWFDNIAVPLNWVNKQPPAVEPPANGPYSGVRVDHWFGTWRCGSGNVGQGRPLQNGTGIRWQRYVDHGDHQ
ncbi:MAG: hypothetical protein IT175_08060 [Acidobacteria bacterium]|nr:hypothetical protein [Acidobacteriota bacterium]